MILEQIGTPLSRFSGCIANCPIPKPLRKMVLGQFAKQFGINLDEAEFPLEHYGSLNDFFTRNLKKGCRPIDSASDHLTSPVDGVLLACGEIEDNTLLQAKGLPYTLEDLLASEEEAEQFAGGHFGTIYLAPHDCHRIFSPCDGEVTHMTHVPGKLLPVREPYISGYSNLYTVNERLVCHMNGPKGPIAMIMVGATNVGHISSPLDKSIRTNISKQVHNTTYYPSPLPVHKGQWTHTFHLGSTVILVLSEGYNAKWTQDLNAKLKLGESLISFS